MTIPHAVSTPKKSPAATTGTYTIDTTRTAQQEPQRRNDRRNGPKKSHSFGTCVGFLAAIIAVAFVGAALVLLRIYVFSENYHTGYHDGDQVLVSQVAEDYSSLVCETYKVKPWVNGGANIYLTDGPATIRQDTLEGIFIQNPGLRSHEEYDYKAFYLLQGSTIETTACMSIFNQAPLAHAEILFIKGNDLFDQWTQDADCISCVEHRVTITPDALCENMQGVLARFVVKDADTYYVVITRQHRALDDAPFKADVSLKVMKTIYDVRNAKQKCLNAMACTLNLTFNANDDVILQYPFPEFSPSTDLEWDQSYDTTCGIRETLFVIVFAIVPASIICIITLASCFYCMHQDARERKERLNRKKAEIREALAMPEPDQQPQNPVPPV